MEKKNANILLLSDNVYEYEVLKEAGYKNVFWFQSSLRAYEYFLSRVDELWKFDIILYGTRALNYYSSGKYEGPINRVTFWDDDVEKMIFFSGKNPGDEEELFYISSPNVTSLGVAKEQFLSVLNDLIPEELKEENIDIPKVEEKEVLLPKNINDVKVLFMGYHPDLVKEELRKAGFTNYTDFYSIYDTFNENVEKLADYDLVITYKKSVTHMALLDKELEDYMRDKGKSIYVVVYYDHANGFDSTDVSITTFATDESISKRNDYLSIGSDEDTLRDIIRAIINLYGTYNKNIGISGYPTIDDLKEKYKKEKAIVDAENKRVLDNMYMLAQIHKYALEYKRYKEEGKILSYLSNVRVDILKDGVSIALIVGNREALRLTFRDKDTKAAAGSHMYLEYLSEKGKMLPAVYRNYYEYYNPTANIPDLLSDDELKKIKALYNKCMDQLIPMIDKITKEERERQEKEYRDKFNKKYNKTYQDKNK